MTSIRGPDFTARSTGRGSTSGAWGRRPLLRSLMGPIDASGEIGALLRVCIVAEGGSVSSRRASRRGSAGGAGITTGGARVPTRLATWGGGRTDTTASRYSTRS